ncbi:hypothetical protein SSE37_01645 [Sagittula stellata E-37]|uniref:Uncharacterized protein n=1 Tax=Sagittula stellata (strain ATCC 700073 / DSM 11524 / E-37) TaxID=388399 RepID=A3K4L7_SAGS3|nr:hypothetical protein SSE37_01645 [Sagittula stellata E-37]
MSLLVVPTVTFAQGEAVEVEETSPENDRLAEIQDSLDQSGVALAAALDQLRRVNNNEIEPGVNSNESVQTRLDALSRALAKAINAIGPSGDLQREIAIGIETLAKLKTDITNSTLSPGDKAARLSDADAVIQGFDDKQAELKTLFNDLQTVRNRFIDLEENLYFRERIAQGQDAIKLINAFVETARASTSKLNEYFDELDSTNAEEASE